MAQYGSINIRFTATKDSFDKALGQIGGAVNRFGNEAKRVFQKATEDSARFNAEAAKTPGLLDKTTKELKEFRRAAEGIYFAGLHLTYIGAALSGMAFLPIKAAADFERAMSKVLAVTTGAENRFTELQKVASELGRTTKFTATEVANGLSFLGLAGFTAAESISAIEPALHLAAAGAIDLATSADIASNVLQAMRLPVHELTQVTDVLANTATSANTNILQLAEALKYAAPPAAAAGIEIEQLAALLGTLGNAGIQASLAGTSLRAILASLAKPSKEAQETMQRLGVAVTTTGRGAIDLVKTLEDLGRAQLTLADANAIFQRRGAAAALTLAQQIDKVHELTAANELAQGAAERMAVTMEDNVTGAFIRVTSAADGLARSFADPLLPVLKEILLWVANTTTEMAAMAEQFPILSGGITALAGVTGILVTVLGLTALGFGTIRRAAALLMEMGLLKWLASLRVALVAANYSIFQMGLQSLFTGAKVGLLTRAIAFLTRTTKLFFKILISNPFLAVAAGIIAIVMYLKSWKEKQAEVTEELKNAAFAANDMVNSFDDLQDAIDRSIKGSKEQGEATKRLRKNLEEYSKENKDLAAVALEAATAINQETGAIYDVNGAIDAFFAKLDEKRLQSVNEHLSQMGDNIEQVDDRYRGLSFAIAAVQESLLSLNRMSSNLMGWESADPMGPFIERAKEFNAMSEVFILQSKKYFLEMFNAKKLDVSLTEAQMNAWLDLAYTGPPKYRSLVLKALGDASVAFIRAQEAQIDIAGKTGVALEKLFQARIDNEIAGLQKLINTYDLVKGAADSATQVASVNQLFSAINEGGQDTIATIQQLSKVQGDLANEARKQTLDWIKRNEKLLNITKDTGNRERIEAEITYLRTIRDKRDDEHKRFLADLGEKHIATIYLNALLIEDDKALSSKKEELADYDWMIWNKYAKLRARLDTKIEKQRVKAMEEGTPKLAAIYAQEMAEFKRSREYMVATELQEAAMREAIWERHLSRLKKLLRKQSQEKLEFEVAIKKASMEKAQNEFDEFIIGLESAKEQGLKTEIEVIRETELKKIELANLEIEKLLLQLKLLDPDVQKDKILKVKLEAQVAGVESEISQTIKESEAAQEQSNFDMEQENLRHVQKVNDILAGALGEGQLAERYDFELAAMKAAHEEQLAELARQGLVTLEQKRQYKEMEDALDAQYAAKVRERDYALVEQRLQIWGMAAGAISSMAGDMFKALGEESKAWFNLQKAAAIAEAIINGAVAVTNAYKNAPNVYIAAMQAALIGARVGAQIAVISSQQYPAKAEGGELGGTSPHPKADNMLFRGTAGEWVMSNASVSHYGKAFMQAINQRKFPQALSKSMSQTYHQERTINSYAGGGQLTPSAQGNEVVNNISLPIAVNLPENLSSIQRRIEAELEPVVLRILQEELRY